MPDIFTREPAKAGQLSKARAGAEAALQRAEDLWLEASSTSEDATG
jgi:ATP-binding cassette subfamily F protein 3